ncbi:MAG: MarR family transcriptional regulator [Alphaproteobacteria bacterium]|nr:MarR family transcriptional regulator [Alphaproteobacteria bacterium]
MVSALKVSSRSAQKTDDPVLEDQVGFAFRRAYQRVVAAFAEVVRDPSLTPQQFAALLKLHETGGLSQNHLGRLTAMDPATIQGVIRRLEKRRLIVRDSDPMDRRRSVLRLSPEGRAYIEQLLPSCSVINEKALAPLSADERRQLLTLLRRLT